MTEVERRSIVTRLGEGVDATGALGDEPQRRVFGVLARYADAIAEHGAERTTAVLTSAVRDASNGAGFADTVRTRFGFDARIIDGDEEARLTYLGATATRDAPASGGLLVIDIGGGSTELVVGEGAEVVFHVSTQIGVVRHSERHLHSDPPAAEELAALTEAVERELARAVPEREGVVAAVAVAGTATQAAGIDRGAEGLDVEGHRLSDERLRAMLTDLASVPLARRREVPGLDPDRAPTIVSGVVVLLCALAAFGLAEVEVSDRDILWGAAIETGRSTTSN